MKQRFVYLINNYFEKVEFGIEGFQKIIGDIYPLKAWRMNIITQKGLIDENLSYEFHGVGCTFLLNGEYLVDFDFTPDRQHNGFDLWRLREFLEYHKDDVSLTKLYSDIKILESDFNEALANNEIVKIPNSNLFKLNSF